MGILSDYRWSFITVRSRELQRVNFLADSVPGRLAWLKRNFERAQDLVAAVVCVSVQTGYRRPQTLDSEAPKPLHATWSVMGT